MLRAGWKSLRWSLSVDMCRASVQLSSPSPSLFNTPHGTNSHNPPLSMQVQEFCCLGLGSLSDGNGHVQIHNTAVAEAGQVSLWVFLPGGRQDKGGLRCAPAWGAWRGWWAAGASWAASSSPTGAGPEALPWALGTEGEGDCHPAPPCKCPVLEGLRGCWVAAWQRRAVVNPSRNNSIHFYFEQTDILKTDFFQLLENWPVFGSIP